MLITGGINFVDGGVSVQPDRPPPPPPSSFLWNWGSNYYGTLGNGTTTSTNSPVQNITSATWASVSSGGQFATGIKTDGTLWTWGFNNNGELGDNTVIRKSSPVQTVAGGTSWSKVSGAQNHVAAIKTDGTLWTWGYNPYGGLGDNTSINKSSPVQTAAGGTTWRTVSAGGTAAGNCAAIKTDGTLWTWGYNTFGVLGDGTEIYRSSPGQTAVSGTNWAQVSSGGYHMMAIKTDGTLWTWGKNDQGQLGTNDRTHRSQPVQTVTGGTNWSQVDGSIGGFGFTVAIKTDGTLWNWGSAYYGTLGDNTNLSNPKSSPIQTVAGGTNWANVSVGFTNTAAIKTDGTLWTWGQNYGTLGDGTSIFRSSPVQTTVGGTNWSQVSVGNGTTQAIRIA
jgi:hypothetical protein